MAFTPTPSQNEAITCIDRHVAVTAGAGSGKTRVLVERYLNLLNKGIEVEDIVAITFTKKAAQEMKDRLRSVRPDLIESLEQAQISTIHSLCQRIIHEHPLQACIDPRFRVAEEWESSVLLTEAFEDSVEGQEIPEELGSAGDVVELGISIYEKMASKGDLDFARFITQEESLSEFPLLQLKSQVEEALQLQPSTNTQKLALEGLQMEWPSIYGKLNHFDDDLRLEALELLMDFVKKIRGKLADEILPLRELIGFAEQGIYSNKGAMNISFLAGILVGAQKLYEKRKKSLGILDFNDLEQIAYELLQKPEVKEDYAFAHLMVDEFQDTNPLQKRIVDALVSDKTILFVVGDPKQSIYRFRGADVGVFVQTKEEIEDTGKNIFLEQNFRSRPELIEFVNEFFQRLMEDDLIGYEASIAHKERAKDPCVKILKTYTDDLPANESRILEAEQIALKIRQLVDEEGFRYKDISLLFRAMTNVHIYEKALKVVGVPYVNLSGRGFYSKQEIQDILNYFRWLEDAGDEVSKMAVLRSPFYLISDQGLFWLKQDRIHKLTGKERKALERARRDYEYLTELARFSPAPYVITSLLERTKYLESTFRLPFGPQKVANVEKLLEQSWDLFALDFYSLPEQLRFLRAMVQDAPKEGEALLDAEHADVVVLRTIHGAKGLEFPVVFLPDTNGDLLRGQRGDVLYHPDFGLTYRNMDSYEALKEQESAEEISEAKRLLYVALTRAEERFYWCAREGKAGGVSWWSWLQEHLDELPSDLYGVEQGDLPGIEPVDNENEVSLLETVTYDPLPPEYNQVSFSVTSLMNYVRCPRYYYLRYILGVPDRIDVVSAGSEKKDSPSINALQRGNIVHRVCEQIKNPEELPELVQYAATMEGVQLEQRQREQLEEIIMPYLNSEFFSRIKEKQNDWDIFREKEFIIPVENYLINGLVDQVFVGKDGLEVVDFKSNWISAQQVQTVGESYEAQLRLYAWAMAKKFGKPTISSKAYFLIPNKLYDLDDSFLDTEQTESWIREICTKIINGATQGVEAFPITLDCTHCGQNSYCGNSGVLGKNKSVT